MMQKVCFCMMKRGLLERKRAPFSKVRNKDVGLFTY